MSADSYENIIDFAIEQEQKAAELYEKTAKKAKGSGIFSILIDMAKMERGHEEKLKAFKAGKDQNIGAEEVEDIKIGDYLVDIEITDSSSIQDVLIFSIKSEMKAYELYTRLCELYIEPKEQELFSNLAREELKHKSDLQKLYDDQIYQDN
ncbi:MAG: ferritin family protein [Candidatus Marinimicrobia bacterium]|nr:ferritin family protein [Candidatus Neomarinimicrobiota bacterium]